MTALLYSALLAGWHSCQAHHRCTTGLYRTALLESILLARTLCMVLSAMINWYRILLATSSCNGLRPSSLGLPDRAARQRLHAHASPVVRVRLQAIK
jgi:hypothetical protein